MGIEGVSQRIADIQSRMMSMQTQQATATQAKPATAVMTAASGAAFAGQLQSAMTSVLASATAGVAPADRTHQLNGKGIPVELAAYGNGRIPPEALSRVGSSSHQMWAPAAENLHRMIEDAKRDGVRIGITDSYRPLAEQVDLARRKGLYSQGGLAAQPGTSEHGWGMAADLSLDAKALSWMRQHAKDYGFAENVPRESWHWAFRPRT